MLLTRLPNVRRRARGPISETSPRQRVPRWQEQENALASVAEPECVNAVQALAVQVLADGWSHVYVLPMSRMEVKEVPAHLLQQMGGGARHFHG